MSYINIIGEVLSTASRYPAENDEAFAERNLPVALSEKSKAFLSLRLEPLFITILNSLLR
jgi:hypothetical protein